MGMPEGGVMEANSQDAVVRHPTGSPSKVATKLHEEQHFLSESWQLLKGLEIKGSQ